MKLKNRLLPALLALLTSVTCIAASAQPVSFGLFGDTPYNRWERGQLPELIAEMGRDELAFVAHVGDIKSGSTECSDAVLKDMLGVFQASTHPLVYVPGDNEWTDCHRSNNGGYDPLERLAKLRELFYAGDMALGKRPLPLLRQSNDPANLPAFALYRENVRWEAGGVLFVGLNLPGSDNNYSGSGRSGPVPEFIARSAANRAWLAQAFAQARGKKLAGILIAIQANPEFEAASAGHPRAGYREFIKQLREETQAFSGQVVLVHGDSHHQQINQPLLDAEGKNVVSNFTRVETYGSPAMGWIKATVDVADPRVFRFALRPWRTTPPFTN